MRLSLPISAMTDRVDVLRTSQYVRDNEVSALDESVAAFEVPCLIIEASAAKAQTLLGTMQENAFLAHFESDPDIKPNDILRVIGSGARYVVKTVRKYPSPHDCQMQVAEMTQDLVQTPQSPP